MKLKIYRTVSYGTVDSEPPEVQTEVFSNNVENYREGTKWSGIFLAFLSGTFFTISAALVKSIKNVDPMVVLSIRAFIQIIVMTIVGYISSINLIGPRGSRLLVQTQGIVGGMTLSLLYYSFRKLPLGDATTIIFSSPVLVMVLSFFFLKEPCGVLRITVIGALITGVILVAQPPFIFRMHQLGYDIPGYICAILATFFTAINLVVMRKCSDIHYSVIVLNLSAWTIVSASLLFSIAPINPTANPLIEPINQVTDQPIINVTDLPIFPVTEKPLATIITENPVKATTMYTGVDIVPPWPTNQPVLTELNSSIFPKDGFTWLMILLVSITGLMGQILVAKALKIEGASKVSVTRSLDMILAYIIQVFFFDEIPSTTSIVGALLIFFSVICMGFEKEIYSICDYIP
ncbi:solute carrier family 35 member G1-like [Phymastichus coffea]|uniref:solute carrier family 35 member G1-like n=1 Tax=Phymastichus coffea TaxID=108790 RepID=UPI00273B6188|nr:solute carrier family 35 member G1-like [Phymastichus coffea]